MPLLRQSLYSQNVNLYLAPTADARDTWLSLMRTVACEGRCVVLSANQCVKKSELPGWYEGDGVVENGAGNQNGIGHESGGKRRKSMVVENGHEIALPDDKSPLKNGTPRTRRRSTIIEGGHEIVLPSTASDEVITEEEPTTNTSKNGNTSPDEYACRGGSCIISSTGAILAGPLWEDSTSLLSVDVDFEDCIRGRLDLDVGGSYSRYVSISVLV